MSREFPAAPRVGIGVVVLRGEAVLLIRRGRPPGLGQWSLPGGGQELGETAEAAARRELREETGLTVGAMVLAGYADQIHHDAEGRVQFHYTVLDFAARYQGGEARCGDDAADLAWVMPADFAAYGVTPAVQRMVGQAQQAIRHIHDELI
ncbi:MAG TPA: NUDIX hydrolase [Acidiphilium sp.]|nr:MAG: phosphohydrolase [Acidiphilium sp. 21-60-14]OYV90180.1 MAG: phosphohydrolase [Acidiphilium sp. 37-60-79]HQT89371.1 NUDIX hydrolase [Acidiphilium sp.]HQU24903.1 NUDIX hydrolase [Acidiphilium sp.]